MKITDPRQAHQAIPSSNVTPRNGDDGTRTPGAVAAPEEHARAEPTEPHNAPPTIPPSTFTEAESVLYAVKDAFSDMLKIKSSAAREDRLYDLVVMAAHGVLRIGQAPAADDLVEWAARVLDEIDRVAAQRAARLSETQS